MNKLLEDVKVSKLLMTFTFQKNKDPFRITKTHCWVMIVITVKKNNNNNTLSQCTYTNAFWKYYLLKTGFLT